jgi:hypothetical protein
MEFVTVLRELWTRRLIVAGVAVVALLAGLFVAFQPPDLRSRQYDVGVASARALVDTPSSAVVDLGGEEDSTAVAMLPGRAALLATVMVSSPLKEEIAKRAGIPADKLIAVAAGTTPSGRAASPDKAQKVDDREAYRLSVQFETDLPLLMISTQAPDPAVAQKLADGAIASLVDHLQSVAGVEGVPDARRLTVKQLGPARAAIETRGPRRLFALVLAFFVFGIGCAAIIGVSWFRRTWRLAAELEKLSALEDDEDDPRWATPPDREPAVAGVAAFGDARHHEREPGAA